MWEATSLREPQFLTSFRNAACWLGPATCPVKALFFFSFFFPKNDLSQCLVCLAAITWTGTLSTEATSVLHLGHRESCSKHSFVKTEFSKKLPFLWGVLLWCFSSSFLPHSVPGDKLGGCYKGCCTEAMWIPGWLIFRSPERTEQSQPLVDFVISSNQCKACYSAQFQQDLQPVLPPRVLWNAVPCVTQWTLVSSQCSLKSCLLVNRMFSLCPFFFFPEIPTQTSLLSFLSLELKASRTLQPKSEIKGNCILQCFVKLTYKFTHK